METIVNFLHEWAIPGLLLCILILVIIGIRQHRVNNSANEEDNESSGEGGLPLAEESSADEETDLLPGDADGVEKLRKEFKTLGGKSAEKMTSSERTRYAALAHVLTLYRY